MRRPHRPHHYLRSKPSQFELFAPLDTEGSAEMPEWKTLPEETRRALTSLIVRLLLDHTRSDQLLQREEVRYDDI